MSRVIFQYEKNFEDIKLILVVLKSHHCCKNIYRGCTDKSILFSKNVIEKRLKCQIHFFCNHYYIRQKFILIYIIVKKYQKYQKQKRKTNFLKHIKIYKRQFKKV